MLRLLLFLPLPLLLACEVIDARTLAPGAGCDPEAPLRCEGPLASCLPLGGGAGVCTHACTRNEQCPGGLVCEADLAGTTARCVPGFRCSLDTECPAGHRCDSDTGSCYIPVQRGLCSPCTADAQCPDGGSCAEMKATGERFCTVSCDDCPASGFECREMAAGPAMQCMPRSETCQGQRPLCAPCDGDAQCGDGNDLCVKNFVSGERFCGLSCNPACNDGSCASACTEGFHCSDFSGQGVGPFQCVPRGGSCAGWCDVDAGCAPGQVCDADEKTCVPALDGRACAPCADDDDCSADSRCVRNPIAAESFCAPVCDEGASCTRSAGPGFLCTPVGSASVCIPGGGTCRGGLGAIGAACGLKGAAGCVSGICLVDGDVGLCSARCSSDVDCGDATFQCCAVVEDGDGDSWDCTKPVAAAGGICAPLGGFFGDGCEIGRSPCQGGHCLDLGTSRLCTAACSTDSDCDAASGATGAFVCRKAEMRGAHGSGELVDICFPAGGGDVGSDCTFGPAACSEQICISKESGNICSKRCAERAACPAGWSCDMTKTVDGRELEICLPPSVGG